MSHVPTGLILEPMRDFPSKSEVGVEDSCDRSGEAEEPNTDRPLRLRETDLVPWPPEWWPRRQRTQVGCLPALNPLWAGSSSISEFWNLRAERTLHLTDNNSESRNKAQRGEALPQGGTAGQVC